MSFIDDILNFLAGPLLPFAQPAPASLIIYRSLIVFGAAFALSLISTLANRFLVDYKMVTNSRREYMAWMKAVNKARKEGDEKQLDKLMKRQAAMMKMNTRASIESFKTLPFTLVPFYLIYQVVRVAFCPPQIGGQCLAVAYSPFPLPWAALTTGGTAAVLTLFYWYLICSFTISIPLSRIFGVNTFQMAGVGGGDNKPQ